MAGLRLKVLLLTLLLGLAAMTVYSQTGRLRFNHLSVDDGLSFNTAQVIYQDHQGFIWIGTKDGLNRYDGQKVEIFRHRLGDSLSLPNNNITAIFEDSKKRLWIGTMDGLCQLDRQRLSFRFYPSPLKPHDTLIHHATRVIYQTQDDQLWVGTDIGLLRLDEEKGTLQPNFVAETSTVLGVLSMVEDHDANFWIGTNHGLFRRASAQKVFEPIPLNNWCEKTGRNISGLVKDRKGNLWIGTACGLYHWHKEQRQVRHIPLVQDEALERASIMGLTKDKVGNIWAGTFKGLYGVSAQGQRVRFEKPRPYDPTSLNDEAIISLFCDQKGDLWLGTYYGGVNVCHFDKNAFHQLIEGPAPFGLDGRVVGRMSEDDKGNLWIGTEDGGLNCYELATGKFQHHRIPGLPESYLRQPLNIQALLYHKGTLWIGTYGRGLIAYDIKQGRTRLFSMENLPGFTNNNLISLLIDRQDRIWLGTDEGGLMRLFPDQRKVQAFRFDPRASEGISHDVVFEMAEDADGFIWVGTYGKGLDRFNPATGHFSHYAQDELAKGALRSGKVTSLYPGEDGTLWIGTEGGGLHSLEKGSREIKHMGTAQGLPDNTIYGILSDDNGALWLSTNRGLVRYDIQKQESQIYGEVEGLGGSQFNYRSYHKMRSGVLFFGGIHHLTYFHPDSIRHNAYQAPVVITGLQLFNKEVEFQDAEGPLTQPIDQLDHLTLTYQDRAISLEFVTLDYTMPSLNQYAFMLEGFHEGWQYVGTQRMATFTNLSPGTYTFKVKGTNADGVWSGQAATLNLEILPPFWRTNWAILTYVLIGLGLLFGLRKFTHAQWTLKHNLRLERMRREKIEELNQAKLAFFTNVSHELRTPLTMIMGPLEQLKRIGQKNPEASEQLNLMHRNADRLLRLINQLLDFTKVDTSVQEPNLAYGEVRSTIQQIVIPFKDFAVRQKVHFLEKTAFSALWMNLDQEKLDKILYNLLSNAFKFTPQGGQVKLSMWVEEKENGPYLHLGVADTGVGIPGEEKAKIFDRFYQGENGSRIQEVGTGIGLALTMELVRVLGGEIEVESEEGRGTNFIVSLPLGEGYELKEMDAGMEEHILASPVARPSVPFMVAEAISGNPQEVGERPKVLIIEDNPDVRTFLRLSLEQQFLIEEAVSGEEGLLVMQDSTPDLVVCDVMMPQMDGIEVTKRIKSNLRYSHVPVILLTAQTALEYKLQGLEMGADDYIAKPFHPEILRARIHNLISNRRQLHHRFVQMNPFAEVQLTANPTDERFMRSVLELMHERMGDPGFSVKELASAIGMSHSVLYRKIKGLTGLNAKEFMVNLRLHKAAQLLKQPGIKVSEVAFEVGFNDPRYFSTAFRKQFKLSPSQYMAQGQE